MTKRKKHPMDPVTRAKKANQARNRKMTAKQRSDSARKAALGLWAKIRKGDLQR